MSSVANSSLASACNSDPPASSADSEADAVAPAPLTPVTSIPPSAMLSATAQHSSSGGTSSRTQRVSLVSTSSSSSFFDDLRSGQYSGGSGGRRRSSLNHNPVCPPNFAGGRRESTASVAALLSKVTVNVDEQRPLLSLLLRPALTWAVLVLVLAIAVQAAAMYGVLGGRGRVSVDEAHHQRHVSAVVTDAINITARRIAATVGSVLIDSQLRSAVDTATVWVSQRGVCDNLTVGDVDAAATAQLANVARLFQQGTAVDSVQGLYVWVVRRSHKSVAGSTYLAPDWYVNITEQSVTYVAYVQQQTCVFDVMGTMYKVTNGLRAVLSQSYNSRLRHALWGAPGTQIVDSGDSVSVAAVVHEMPLSVGVMTVLVAPPPSMPYSAVVTDSSVAWSRHIAFGVMVLGTFVVVMACALLWAFVARDVSRSAVCVARRVELMRRWMDTNKVRRKSTLARRPTYLSGGEGSPKQSPKSSPEGSPKGAGGFEGGPSSPRVNKVSSPVFFELQPTAGWCTVIDKAERALHDFVAAVPPAVLASRVSTHSSFSTLSNSYNNSNTSSRRRSSSGVPTTGSSFGLFVPEFRLPRLSQSTEASTNIAPTPPAANGSNGTNAAAANGSGGTQTSSNPSSATTANLSGGDGVPTACSPSDQVVTIRPSSAAGGIVFPTPRAVAPIAITTVDVMSEGTGSPFGSPKEHNANVVASHDDVISPGTPQHAPMANAAPEVFVGNPNLALLPASQLCMSLSKSGIGAPPSAFNTNACSMVVVSFGHGCSTPQASMHANAAAVAGPTLELIRLVLDAVDEINMSDSFTAGGGGGGGGGDFTSPLGRSTMSRNYSDASSSAASAAAAAAAAAAAVGPAEATVISVTSQRIVIAWNAFVEFRAHPLNAANAAIMLSRVLAQSPEAMSLAPAIFATTEENVATGVVGNEKIRSPVLISRFLLDTVPVLETLAAHLSTSRMARPSPRKGSTTANNAEVLSPTSGGAVCPVFVTDALTQRVTSHCLAFPVDLIDAQHVQRVTKPHASVLYQLVPAVDVTPQYRADFDTVSLFYREAFDLMRTSEFATAAEYFVTFMENNPGAWSVMLWHAARLYRICMYYSEHDSPVPFCRPYESWAHFEAIVDVSSHLPPDVVAQHNINTQAAATWSMSGGAILHVLTGSLTNTNSSFTTLSPQHSSRRGLTAHGSGGSGGFQTALVAGSPQGLLSDFDEVRDTTTNYVYRRGETTMPTGLVGSRVWLGLCVDNGSLVLLHVSRLGPESPSREDHGEYLKACTQLRHDNLVDVYGYSFLSRRRLVLVTEYVSGGTLEELLETFPFVPISTVQGYVIDILHALQHLHGGRITHGDVCTRNVRVTINGVCKLSNWTDLCTTLEDARADFEERSTRDLEAVGVLAGGLLRHHVHHESSEEGLLIEGLAFVTACTEYRSISELLRHPFLTDVGLYQTMVRHE
eukprot:PhM_4_TR674/c0_g1_i1/m.78848